MAKRAGDNGESERLFLIKVEGYGIAGHHYWIYILASSKATFKDLDKVFRATWLECCGHMSQFRRGMAQISMNKLLGWFLRPGMKVLYEYDMGDTTSLLLTAAGEVQGTAPSGKVEILARNAAPSIACVMCGEEAKEICPQCTFEGEGWLCKKCGKNHDCGLGVFLPLANSPRTGVCGYRGEKGAGRIRLRRGRE